MDRMAYIAMSGAKQAMQAQSLTSHNIANVSTVGFRADMQRFASEPVYGEVQASRVNAVTRQEQADFTLGSMMNTGGELDVAIQGEGWIAVQAPDGSEAMTRAGDLQLNEFGQLLTGAGHPVLGDGGPVALPPGSNITIGNDGSISLVPLGQTPNTVAVVDRIKLVNPPRADITKGLDGLFRTSTGTAPEADAGVTLSAGVLEGSNVNAASALVDMINFSRQFEMQVKLIGEARDNADASAAIMRVR
ncbi:MAG: flagellar basal-body rod protein FlgF [Pseudomonadota bacterium]